MEMHAPALLSTQKHIPLAALGGSDGDALESPSVLI